MRASAGRLALAGGLLVIVLCATIFGPWLRGPFLWDDTVLVEHNPLLTRSDGIWQLLVTDMWEGAGARSSVLYHPVPMVSLWLQARVTGLSVVGFRLGNLAIHALCAVLFFGFLRRQTLGRTAAAGAALVLLIHPSATEPVMWIVGRQDSLGALFSLGAMLAWPDRSCPRSTLRAAAAGLLCAMAMLCKEPFVVVVVLLLARAAVDRVPWRRALLWLAFPAAATAATLALRRALGIPLSAGGSPGSLHALAIYATILWHYLAQLATFDNGPAVASFRLLPWPAVATVYTVVGAAMVLLVRAAWSGGRRAALAVLGALWFILGLGPQVVSVPQFGVYGNRYAYFPLMGLLVVGATAADALAGRARQPWRRIAFLAALLLGVTAGARTAMEARAWGDELSLFGHRLDPEDGNALYRYAVALLGRQGCRAALPELAHVVELVPKLGPAWHNLAGCLLSTGRYHEAAVAARRSLALEPGNPGAEFNLGAALVFAGQTSEGIPHLETATRLDPHHARAAQLLAELKLRATTHSADASPAP